MVILWHITDISPRKNTDQGDFLLKRAVHAVNEKHEAITKMESGKSARAVAKKMEVGKTQISKWKAEILCDIENNVPGERKRKRHKTGNEEINDLCWSWFQEAMTKMF